MSNELPARPSYPADEPDFGPFEPAPYASVPYAAYRPKFQNKLWKHVLLFVLTALTTTLAGAEHYAAFASEFGRRSVTLDMQLLLNGLWYSGTFLAILGAHEMGHYLMCRRYNVDATLPYFIPLPPFLFLTGTLGAVIRIREQFPSKRELFDIGVAGPIAGFVLVIPALLCGAMLSPVVPAPTDGIVYALGEPLAFQWATRLIAGPIPDGYTINMHPMLFAGWWGLLATALNLLPFGQLDGGHIAYAALGDRASRTISRVTALIPVAMLILSVSWLLPAIMMLVMWRLIGVAHPVPLNPHTRLSPGRRVTAAAALAMLIVSFTPSPLRVQDLVRAPYPSQNVHRSEDHPAPQRPTTP